MARPVTQLWPETPTEADGLFTVSATIDNPALGKRRLWYRVPARFKSHLTTSCDPFVVATTFLQMTWGADLVVHGTVSPSLLANLEEFQAVWAFWCPDSYQAYEIRAEHEEEDARAEPPSKSIAAFSGGIDSSFTVLRHRTGLVGRHYQRDVEAGLLVQGFDIPLDKEQAFKSIARGARETLASVKVDLITMACNYRDLSREWEHAHGAVVSSCLMLLKGRYVDGLIGSTYPYDSLAVPWGSLPVTDHLLSSQSFAIVHDGAAVRREQKVRVIADWKECVKNLHVCWQAPEPDQNCGKCIKCVKAVLCFRAWGLEQPASLPAVSDRDILNIRDCEEYDIPAHMRVAEVARENGVSGSWVKAWERTLRHNRRLRQYEKWRRRLKGGLRRLLRRSKRRHT